MIVFLRVPEMVKIQYNRIGFAAQHAPTLLASAISFFVSAFCPELHTALSAFLQVEQFARFPPFPSE
ncbi:MAG: hypothetical protein KAY54_01775 [Burkholderiaceae bacterium]|nr:hypothetical protein [Burkholderiaceae bacterium]